MPADLSFLQDSRLGYVMTALEDAGYEALVVGGAARDGLMGTTPKDIDLATNARPDAVASVLGQAGADMRPTGLDHGTWTALIGGAGFEITTYRRDVATDGRRATIAFADTFAEDAQRRDFTINALALTKNGTPIDPTGQGLRDLHDRRVRFVGDGAQRCAEDSLRALRLFRFQSRMGSWPMDKDALHAAAGADMSHLSGERIWSEVRGIMHTPQADKAAQAMHEVGMWAKILPNTPIDTRALAALTAREAQAGLDPSWSARIHALTGRDRLPWPISGAEAKRLGALSKHAAHLGRPEVAAASAQSAQTGTDLWALGTTPIPAKGVAAMAAWGAQATMPVAAADFMARGIAPGPALGQAMHTARAAWLQSGLHADAQQLVEAVPVRAATSRTGGDGRE